MILTDSDREQIRQRLAAHHEQLRAHEPPEPVKPIDIRPDIAAVADAIKAAAVADTDSGLRDAIAGVAKAIKGQNLKPLADAIAGITLTVPEADYRAAVADIVKAIDANTSALKSVATAMRAERELVLDDDGKPVGTRVVRAN